MKCLLYFLNNTAIKIRGLHHSHLRPIALKIDLSDNHRHPNFKDLKFCRIDSLFHSFSTIQPYTFFKINFILTIWQYFPRPNFRNPDTRATNLKIFGGGLHDHQIFAFIISPWHTSADVQ